MSETSKLPQITPADLLAEDVTQEDLRKLEQVMGRFTSTTNFLNAFKQVLIDLEAGPEAEALDKFIPIMAQTEAAAMNTPSPNEETAKLDNALCVW